jgi:hypothetical protein
MSNALGIASVTHILKDLLYDGLIDHNVSNVTGNPITVSSLPPGELQGSNGGVVPSQINIFLYRVSPNTGWNNVAFPTRGSDGKETRGAPLAVNLHYLLTAFGEQELHSEILLGYAMQILHENPVLYREKINDSLDDSSGRLPVHLEALATSGLADQRELIKITPEAINTEEISKLWAAFQIKYRPCTGYVATVLLIESDKPNRQALPVQRRNLTVLPFRYPNISKILSKAPDNNPVLENRRINIGDTLIIQGSQLKNDPVLVRLGGQEAIAAQRNVQDTQISLLLSNALGLKAGIQGVQVVHEITIGTAPNDRDFRWASSNVLAFVLSPRITQVGQNLSPVSTGSPLFEGDVVVDVEPLVQEGQRAVLLLNEINAPSGNDPRAYSFVMPPSDLMNPPTGTLTFSVRNIRSGDYLVRVQIDGAESPLDTNSDGEYDDPIIQIS